MDRTLLVEDNPNTQSWMRRLVERAFPDTTTVTAPNLAGGRAALQNGLYSRAIIDLGLPDGSGVDLIYELTLSYPDTPAIVATIFDDDDHLFRALRAGAKGYVLKDHPEDMLVAILSKLNTGEPPLSPPIAQRMLEFFNQQPLPPPLPADPPSSDAEAVLSSRELEVLEIIGRGATRPEVGRSLGISANTVGTHIKSIYRKLGIASRAEASLAAERLGLLRNN